MGYKFNAFRPLFYLSSRNGYNELDPFVRSSGGKKGEFAEEMNMNP